MATAEVGVPRTTQVIDQFERLGSEMCRAEETQLRVMKALETVLSPMPPETESDRPEDPSVAPLAGQLRTIVRHLADINTRYEQLLDQLEI